MIIFKKVRWKNFLSTGNNFTEIQLDRSSTTLIIGENGAGKSTVLDALCFGLFNKPFRNISKKQLVNSVNNGASVVEVEFSIGKSNFKVIRGAKPNIFEIWKDGVMVNQASHAREYQKILEQNILKLNHKSFHQIIVLGSSSFIPFMQLTSQHRRDVIEDLLDINIFSKMNSIIKEKNAIIKDKIREVTYEIDLLKEKIDLQRKYIREVENLSGEQIKDKEDEAVLAQESIVNIQLSNAILSRDVSELSETLQDDLKKANDKKTSLLHYQATFNQQIKTVVKEAKFFEENESCPTCEQDIDDDLRTSKLELAKGKAGELNTALSKANDQASEVEETLSSLSDIAKKVSDKQNDINNNNKEISRLQTTITNLSKAIDNIRGKDGDISIEKDKLQELNDTRESSFESRLVSNETLSYNIAMSEMLKDTGIKTKIIKQYLPVMNKLVNQYLQTLDFFVHFNLDENFASRRFGHNLVAAYSETIKPEKRVI